jgi:glycosyltransferase involved in cell wall biosynthesis
MRRVAIVYPVPVPYSFPVLRRVAAAPGIELTVFYARRSLAARGAAVDPATLGFRHVFLPDAGRVFVGREVREIDFNPTLPRELEHGDFDLVVTSGFVQPSALLAIAWARLRRRRYGILSESHGLRTRSASKRVVRRTIVGPLVRSAGVLFPTGALAADALRELGAKPERMVALPHVPDPEVFSPGAADPSVLGLPGDVPVVAYVGRLIESKGVRTLLEAHLVTHAATGAVLAIAGGGPLDAELRAAAPAGVKFLGQLSPVQVAELFRVAAAAAIPSLDEPWGTVVLEAMACGCPVVASSAVASAVEIVGACGGGRLVAPRDPAALSAALREVVEDSEVRARLSIEALKAAGRFTPEASATSFLRGVEVGCV